ncbi:MAG: hypothetical protein ACRDZ1_09840 [Acidimicrobiia bacterium]
MPVRELVGVADFLTPELHRNTGADDAAEAVSEWAEGDAELLVEAEEVARSEHHDESAELLHRAADEVSGGESRAEGLPARDSPPELRGSGERPAGRRPGIPAAERVRPS